MDMSRTTDTRRPLARRLAATGAALLLAMGLSGCAAYDDGYGGNYAAGNGYYAPAYGYGGYGYGGGTTVIFNGGGNRHRPDYHQGPRVERPHHDGGSSGGWGGDGRRDGSKFHGERPHHWRNNG